MTHSLIIMTRKQGELQIVDFAQQIFDPKMADFYNDLVDIGSKATEVATLGRCRPFWATSPQTCPSFNGG